MKKYRKYKDSGIAWIGEIPDSWDVRKLKFVFTFGKGLSITKDNLTESGVSVISYGQIHSKENHGTGIIDTLRRYVDADYLTTNKQSLVGNNDFIFADTSEDLEGVGNCVFVDNDDILFAGYHTIILKAKDIHHNKYLAYLFLSDYWRNQIRSRVTGVKVYSITKTILNGNTVLLPSATEQEQIAKYLDWKCGEVDRIVEVRERQIKLLGELRTSVISRAVTRGLNPHAPLKDSGIDWIGQIPKHWEVRKVSRIFSRIGSGTTPKSGNEDYYAENGENWLQTGDLNDSYIYETSKKITKKALDEHSLRFYTEGSIVMAMYGATIGKLGLLNISTTTNQACCVMSGNTVCHIKYSFNTLLAARTHILTLAYGGGQPNISQDTIKTIKLPIPPIEEQQQIADYLDKKTAEIDSTIEKFKTQIDKIKEYRQALITEVVTGKIDVRGIEIPAPKSN